MIDYSQFKRHNVLCLDMKSFFASCECVRRGLSPLDTYLVVVGDKERNGSIVLAATPLMKQKFGIKTGNRLFEVPRLSYIHIAEASMAYYLDRSVEITRLLHRFAPPEAIHPYSIDEAWVCVNGTERIHGNRWEAAHKIKDAILNEFGLPSAIGIGPNKFLSKVILDIEAKKEGIAECTYEQVEEKLWLQPVEDIWGIGSRMKRNLNGMGIRTMEHLANTPIEKLQKRFGVIGEQLYWHAWGIDLSPVIGHYGQEAQKGFGHGITLLRDYSIPEEVKIVILELCEEVARRARTAKMAGRTVHLTIGYSRAENKEGFSRARTVERATNVTMEVYAVAILLFEKNYRGHIVRSVYVSLSNLIPDDEIQLDLFEDVSKKKALGDVMDSIRDRFGSAALLRASSYTKAGTMVARSSKIGGHQA